MYPTESAASGAGDSRLRPSPLLRVAVTLLVLQCAVDYCLAASVPTSAKQDTNMVDQYLNKKYKLDSSENFEEIMKALGNGVPSAWNKERDSRTRHPPPRGAAPPRVARIAKLMGNPRIPSPERGSDRSMPRTLPPLQLVSLFRSVCCSAIQLPTDPAHVEIMEPTAGKNREKPRFKRNRC
ncbi:unnamed protein product [Bemisia tabaci]|uniref:Cytosolic fatty-acid binding proteins domain-containing protein n=1 Tax=Bemisia tabaci TaxID=7038 RepID=A0A9P0A8C8_BEMTA|nr:unnamed protein product [Bemisia tabaci]